MGGQIAAVCLMSGPKGHLFRIVLVEGSIDFFSAVNNVPLSLTKFRPAALHPTADRKV
jgi:hypothetical protein